MNTAEIKTKLDAMSASELRTFLEENGELLSSNEEIRGAWSFATMKAAGFMDNPEGLAKQAERNEARAEETEKKRLAKFRKVKAVADVLPAILAMLSSEEIDSIPLDGRIVIEYVDKGRGEQKKVKFSSSVLGIEESYRMPKNVEITFSRKNVSKEDS